MKKSFVVLCLILFSVSFAFANSEELDCYESQIKGKTDAEIMFNPAGAFLTSTVLSYLLCGILTPAVGGIVGGVISIGTAALIPPSSHTVPVPDEANDVCYRSGYVEVAKGKNMSWALGGALTGTVLFALTAFAILIMVMSSIR